MTSHVTQDIRLLYEAVYDQDLREKADEYNYQVRDEDIVEVATEYFYNYGLNSDGVDILIEKVGLDNFVEFVYDLSEDYVVLDEAKKKYVSHLAKSRQEAKQNAAKAAQERKDDEKKPESRGADTEAKEEQPKSKKPEKGGIRGAISGAIERAKKDIELTKKTAQTVGRAVGVGIEGLNRASDSRLARQARVATHKGVKRHTQALTAAGGALGRTLGASTARRRSQQEGFDNFDIILDHLISEGYADTNEDALAIMANMSEEWKESILDEGYRPINKKQETAMYRRAGNLARTSLASTGRKKLEAAKKSAKIVGVITRQKENERFDEIGKSPAHNP